MTTEPRQLAKACGAAQRVYQGVALLARITSELPNQIAVQGNAVLEELDLLRFLLREETLRGAIGMEVPITAPVQTRPRSSIHSGAPVTPPKARKPRSASTALAKAKAKGGHARAAKLKPARRKAIAKQAAKARWSK
jgi:hypothetical protein